MNNKYNFIPPIFSNLINQKLIFKCHYANNYNYKIAIFHNKSLNKNKNR